MTPKQVQFCHAIAHGQATRARELVSQINITQHDDCGFSPALMCLWALNRDPIMVAKKLDELFPKVDEKLRQRMVVADPKEMETLIREVVLPKLKLTLNSLLKPIGLQVVSLDKVSDNKQNHFVDSAFAAVNVIINDEFFDDINASQRRFAENLFNKLAPIVEKMHSETKVAQPHQKTRSSTPNKEQPYTIQLLMAILNGKTHELPSLPALNLQATLEPIGRTFLPGASATFAKKPLPTSCHQEAREEEEYRYRHRMAPGVH